MKKQNGVRKMGFSLIELSVVILVIGILVAGVTRGGAIINKAKVGAAKSLTTSSPAASIPDMVAWYEPVLETSFNPANSFDGNSLTSVNGFSWLDNSPSKVNSATIGGVAPLYEESGINNLPTVDFSPSNATLTFNASFLNQKDYTIFIVEQKRATTATQRFLNLGNSAGVNAFGYGTNTTITGTTGAVSATVPALVGSAYSPRIITFFSDSNNPTPTTARKVFVNGTVGGTTADATTKITVGSNVGIIGADATAASPSNPYSGYISEIIIYSRALSVTERNNVQDYLSKKYSIKVTVSS